METEAEIAWQAARALDECLTQIRQVAEAALDSAQPGQDVQPHSQWPYQMRAALVSIVRLIGEPAEIAPR